MNKIKSKLFNTIASLGLVISMSATAQQPAAADGTIDTAKEALSLLYPAALAVDNAQKSGNVEAQRAAGIRLTNAQRQITELFGEGPEGYLSYNYKGRNVNVPIDGDLAFIGVQAFTANNDIVREDGDVIKKGEKYLQFSMQPTLAMTTQFHLALNGITPDPNRDVQRDMMSTSATSIYPIGQASTKQIATHVFAIPESVFSDNPNDRNTLPSIHGVPYLQVINEMLAICEDRLDELNDDAMDLFAKPQQP